MELKLTTARALEFEARTGEDITVVMEGIVAGGSLKIKTIVDLFSAMGEGYTAEKFDEWDVSFRDKAKAIVEEVARYLGGSSKN